MCKSNNEKSRLFAIVSGVVIAAAAIASAVYFIMKIVEKKRLNKYIECDCYDEFDDDFDEMGADPEAVSESEETPANDEEE
mgnify:CR=1 FL=1